MELHNNCNRIDFRGEKGTIKEYGYGIITCGVLLPIASDRLHSLPKIHLTRTEESISKLRIGRVCPL